MYYMSIIHFLLLWLCFFAIPFLVCSARVFWCCVLLHLSIQFIITAHGKKKCSHSQCSRITLHSIVLKICKNMYGTQDNVIVDEMQWKFDPFFPKMHQRNPYNLYKSLQYTTNSDISPLALGTFCFSRSSWRCFCSYWSPSVVEFSSQIISR